MPQVQSSVSLPQGPQSSPEEKLRRLPPSALESFRKFQQTGDEAALGDLVMEVLRFFLPKQSVAAQGPAWPEEARLAEDLGFDSLATIETVFFFEDLFQITISNEEIVRVGTIGDLRRFVRAKLGSKKADSAA